MVRRQTQYSSEHDVRYFTMDWWNGDDHTDPVPAYRLHFEAIRKSLPEGLIQLHETVSLHDGRLRRLYVDLTAGIIHIDLDTDDGRGGLRKVQLHYVGVTEFSSTAEHEKGLSGPRGYGDLGYEEVDIVDGSLVHRMLFSGNIEMEIRFHSFVLTYEDIDQKAAEQRGQPERSTGRSLNST
jgi:hypothetical protein